MNTRQFVILASATFASLSVQAARFSAVKLESDGSVLQALRTDGSVLPIPKIDNQDEFQKPDAADSTARRRWC